MSDDVELSLEELFATVVNAQGGEIRVDRNKFDEELAGDMLAVDYDENTEEVIIRLAWREDVVFDDN